MKQGWKKHALALLLGLTLLLAGCGAAPLAETPPDADPAEETLLGEGTVSAEVLVLPVEDGAELGEGDTAFSLTITDGDGVQTHVTVNTDAATVGEALEALGLIRGEEGAYGLYVETVNGITADYDTDKTYWAFYINGEYAMTGVDATELVPGDSYELRVERA